MGQFSQVRKKSWYSYLLWGLFILCIYLIWIFYQNNLVSQWNLATGDFWRYWTAWRINHQGLNPYDSSNLTLFKDTFGNAVIQPAELPVILSPPWTIFMVYPFTLFDYPVSRFLWFILSLLFLLLSANKIWNLYHGSKSSYWIAWMVTFTFFPSIAFLTQGQVSIISLLGLIGFLVWSQNEKNDFLAGAAFSFALFKPHLLLLPGLILLLWIVQYHRWKIFAGCVTALIVTSFVTVIDNPSVIRQFIDEYFASNYSLWITPTFGTLLRFLFGQEKYWLQFLPLVFGLVWVVFFWLNKRSNWIWLREIQPILWVSYLTSTYSFTYDQILLLVPILATLTIFGIHGWTTRNISWLIGIIAINIIAYTMHIFYSDHYFIWFVPILFIWYWLANKYGTQDFEFIKVKDDYTRYSNTP